MFNKPGKFREKRCYFVSLFCFKQKIQTTRKHNSISGFEGDDRTGYLPSLINYKKYVILFSTSTKFLVKNFTKAVANNPHDIFRTKEYEQVNWYKKYKLGEFNIQVDFPKQVSSP